MKVPFPRLFSAALFLSFATPAFCGDPGWSTDYPQALERAKNENKAVLVYFLSSENSDCAKMKDETLDTPEFRHYAQQNLVLVEMDFGKHQEGQSTAMKEQNDDLGQKLGIGGFPTFVLMDGTGRVLGQINGYLAGGPEAFIKKLSGYYTPAPGGRSSGGGGSAGGDDFDSFFKKPAQSPTP